MEPVATSTPLEGMTNVANGSAQQRSSLPAQASEDETASRLKRWPGNVMASVLLVDACCHLYWATGATWPAPDEYSLSVAVLGFGVDFRTSLLLGLALVVATAAALVLA